MKFYVVCWYDDMEDDFNPCFGSWGDIALDIEEVNEVRLYRSKAGATKYMKKLQEYDGLDYRIVEIDVSEELRGAS